MTGRNFLRRFWTPFAMTIAGIMLVGCGGSRVIMQTDSPDAVISNPDFTRQHAQVIRVEDKRTVPDSAIGFAQVGILNKKVPFELDTTLTDFVQRTINTMLSDDSPGEMVAPITVLVDTFRVWEKTGAFAETGHFKCGMRFLYPVGEESFRTVRVSSHQTFQSGDVTAGLRGLVYSGLSECVGFFLDDYDNTEEKYVVSLSDTAHSETVTTMRSEIASEVTQAQKIDKTYRRSLPPSDGYLNVTFLSGDLVETGIQGAYLKYFPNDGSQFEAGYGYGLTFYDIKNPDKFLEGSFLSFSSPLSARYYLTTESTAPYLAGTVKLTFGTETIDYGSETESNFFFGPTLEEKVGISVEKDIQIELGLFQIRHFGSDLLPSDLGFEIAMNISFSGF